MTELKATSPKPPYWGKLGEAYEADIILSVIAAVFKERRALRSEALNCHSDY